MSDREMNEERNFAVWLTRIEGKLDLSSARHDTTDRRLDNHEQRLHRHSNDISSLQARQHIQDGERKGVAVTIKTLWLAGGATVTAIVVAVLKKLGMV